MLFLQLTKPYKILFPYIGINNTQQLLDNNSHVFPLTDVLDVWFNSGNVVQVLGALKGFNQDDMVWKEKTNTEIGFSLFYGSA